MVNSIMNVGTFSLLMVITLGSEDDSILFAPSYQFSMLDNSAFCSDYGSETPCDSSDLMQSTLSVIGRNQESQTHPSSEASNQIDESIQQQPESDDRRNDQSIAHTSNVSSVLSDIPSSDVSGNTLNSPIFNEQGDPSVKNNIPVPRINALFEVTLEYLNEQSQWIKYDTIPVGRGPISVSYPLNPSFVLGILIPITESNLIWQDIIDESNSANTIDIKFNQSCNQQIIYVSSSQVRITVKSLSIPVPIYNAPAPRSNGKTQTSRTYSKRAYKPKDIRDRMSEVLAELNMYKWEQRRKYTHLLYHMIQNDLSFNPTVLSMDGQKFRSELGIKTLEQLSRGADYHLKPQNIIDLIGDVGSDERRRFFGGYTTQYDEIIERDERRARFDKLNQMIADDEIEMSRKVNAFSGIDLRTQMQALFNQAIIRDEKKSRPMCRVLYRMIEKGLFFDYALSNSDPQSLIHNLGGSVSSIQRGGLNIPVNYIDEFIGTPDSDERKRFFGEGTEHDRIKAIEEAKLRQSKLAMEMANIRNQNPTQSSSSSNETVNKKRKVADIHTD